MNITRQMPRYRCHKEVWALKIAQIVPSAQSGHSSMMHFEDSGYGPIEVLDEWIKNRKAAPGGYYVVYADGYQSFSPAEAFEAGYTLIQ